MPKTLLVIVLFLVLPLAGCVAPAWDERKASMVERFHGEHIDEAIKYFGVPVGRIYTSDGSQVVEFRTYNGGYACDDQFTTDPEGIIISSRHSGQHGCVL